MGFEIWKERFEPSEIKLFTGGVGQIDGICQECLFFKRCSVDRAIDHESKVIQDPESAYYSVGRFKFYDKFLTGCDLSFPGKIMA